MKAKDIPKHFWSELASFLSQKVKTKMANSLAPKTLSNIASVILVGTHSCPYLIKILESEQEYKKILSFLIVGKKRKEFPSEVLRIFKKNKALALRRLNRLKKKLLCGILGEQEKSYYQMMKKKKFTICEKILDGRIKASDKKLVENFESVQVDYWYLRKYNCGLNLDEELLCVKTSDKDFLKDLAFLIYRPYELTSSAINLHPAWERFPLKWFFNQQPIPVLKNILHIFNSGKDISNFFEIFFTSDRLSDIIKELDHFAFSEFRSKSLPRRTPIISESINCYKSKYYYASTCLSLLTIEGLVWDLAEVLNEPQMQILKISAGKKMGFSVDNNKWIDDPTVGFLLKNSYLRDFIDSNFINYFCDILYRERNPILHGENFDFGTKEYSAKMLGVVKYFIEVVKKEIERISYDLFEKHAPKKLIDKIVDKRLDEIKNNK